MNTNAKNNLTLTSLTVATHMNQHNVSPVTSDVRSGSRRRPFRSLVTGFHLRRGLTLIEVLSAIAVATIGVFGVLVLVPLASRLSQIGFSNEAARQNASNVIEKAKSFGALNYTRWLRYDPVRDRYEWVFASQLGLSPTGNQAIGLCLDPMLISAPNFDAANAATAPFNTRIINTFPYTRGAAGAPRTAASLDRVTISRDRNGIVPTGFPLSSVMAESMMGERNVLRMSDALSDVVVPTQSYLTMAVGGTNVAMGREMSGSKTALALLLPTQERSSLIYRMMSVVVNNRAFQLDNFDHAFDVFDQTSQRAIVNGEGILDLILQEIDNTISPVSSIPSRGWIILVPYQHSGIGGARVADWRYAKPFQVVSSDSVDIDDNGVADSIAVSIVGAPYTAPSVSVPGTGVPYLDPHTGFNGEVMFTQAIYIPGAVDIRESEVRLDSMN